MTKIYGAGIFCGIYHAEPFPDPGSGYRETFDLLRTTGEWRCELHRSSKPLKQRSRKAQGEAKSEESSP
jgi:hypothetical protein